MGKILLFARGVNDHEQIVPGIRHHQVIEYSALIISEQCVPLSTHWQIHDIDGHERFKSYCRTFTMQANLAHVTDIEQASLVARVQMLLHHPQRILHWHFIASEGNHACPQLQMKIMQRCTFQRFCSHR
ncbi:hypothetical protein D3C78_1184710 [compost metagenome]